MENRMSAPLVTVVAVLAVAVGCHFQQERVDVSHQDPTTTVDVSSDSREQAEFDLRLKYIDVWGISTVLINGFPLDESSGGRIYQNPILTFGLQSGLVRGENTVRIQIEPTTLRHGDALWFPTVRLHGQVTGDYHGDQPIPGAAITEAQVDSAYAEWKEQAEEVWARFLQSEAAWMEANPDRGQEITWRSGGALDSMWAWSREHPVVVSTTFENKAGPDFSDIFLEAPVLTDTVRIRDYAIYLRDRMAARDTLALFEAFRPSYADHYIFNRRSGSVEDDEAILKERVVGDFDLDFERTDIDLRAWSGGRVWEIKRGGKALFEAEWAIRDVYVAEIEGELRVVRR
mgnify:CR=1 FL=1